MPSTAITEVWNGPGRRDGDLTTVLPRHNGLHPSPSRAAFEHWYFDAQLDSGHVVVGFLTKRRPEDLPWARPWVELIVYTPDGGRRQAAQRYPHAATSFSADTCDVRIGDNRAWSEYPAAGLPRHHVRLACDGVAFELTFDNETPSWMPGKGETRFGDGETFGWVVGAPRARVHGTLEIDGEQLAVTGRGYADHNWGVGDMKRIIDRWHWGRLYTDEYSLLYANVLTQPQRGGHAIAPLMLARGAEVVLSTGETVLTEGPKRYDSIAGREFPEWIDLRVPDQLELRLTVESVIHAHDLLDDVPVVRSRVLRPLLHKVIGHPAYFRFRSSFELTIHRDGAVDRQSGTTLHELVALR
ncbi:lipocalin-like domain-containing protein [Nocardia mangyaensis]|uniref:lipocalin-like domain-containing protein n=1 Tax=Nocardia mangyaensis TaxID=2213200 RepID=UPI000A004DF4|nr:lipocalin-like domain-containing protein [Nocardia mangyaensis]